MRTHESSALWLLLAGRKVTLLWKFPFLAAASVIEHTALRSTHSPRWCLDLIHSPRETLALAQSFILPTRICLYQSDCRSGTKNCHFIVTPFAPWLVTAVMAAGLVCSSAWGFICWKQELWSQENFQIILFTYSNRDEKLAGFSASPVFPFRLCHPFTLSCCKTDKALNSSSQPQIAPLLFTVLAEVLSISWFFSPKSHHLWHLAAHTKLRACCLWVTAQLGHRCWVSFPTIRWLLDIFPRDLFHSLLLFKLPFNN